MCLAHVARTDAPPLGVPVVVVDRRRSASSLHSLIEVHVAGAARPLLGAWDVIGRGITVRCGGSVWPLDGDRCLNFSSRCSRYSS